MQQHHHYLTIEQRDTLANLIRSRIPTAARREVALERLHGPDYGICIECGKDVEFVRLEADPLAMHCRSCSRLPVTA